MSSKWSGRGGGLGYPDHEDMISNRVTSETSVVQRESTLTILHTIETDSPVETEIVRVVPLRTTGKKKKKNHGLQGPDALNTSP